MKLLFLGTGTSYGVPYIGCECEVCRSTNPLNKRLRSSILVEEGDVRILVDTTPDMRTQLLRAGVSEISAILWTHPHNDHIIGLDDIRPLSDRSGYINGYANADTIEQLSRVFDYALVQNRTESNFPRVTPHIIEPFQTFEVGPLRITPIPIQHGKREIFAYRFQSDSSTLIYATDCSHIPDESLVAMENADVFVVDALRRKEHVAHFSLGQALQAVERLQPKRALFTHIAHDLEHETINAELPPHVRLAHDELVVELEAL